MNSLREKHESSKSCDFEYEIEFTCGVDLLTKTTASMNILESVEMMRLTLKTTEGGKCKKNMRRCKKDGTSGEIRFEEAPFNSILIDISKYMP